MVAREKQLKASLVDLGQAEFTKKLESVKDEKEDFACAAVHIELHKSKEAASEHKIQPKELQEQEDEPLVQEATPMKDLHLQLAAKEELEPEEVPVEVPKINAHVPGKEVRIPDEIPQIIPAEFSLGRKSQPFAKYTRMAKNMRVTPKNKKFIMGGAVAVVLVAVVVLKSFVFVSASSRALSSAAAEAADNIKLAEAKVSQNDLVGAHAILVGSLASLSQSIEQNGSSEKIADAKNEVITALDTLEQASDATLSPVASIPADSGIAQLLTTSGNDVYAYVNRQDTGAIVKISQDSVSNGVEMQNTSPSMLFGSDNYISAVDLLAKKVTSLSLTKSSVGSITINDALVSADVYQGNLYGITDTGIIKITDAASGHSDVKPWLTAGTLAADSQLIAVDGNIYVLSSNGVLTEYYKGEKKNEFNTPVIADSGSTMLTTTDSPSLYVVNKSLGRIYIINKASGGLERTLKINSDLPIVSATLAADGTIYILTDNKVWEVQ
jgi:hypothetical protein